MELLAADWRTACDSHRTSSRSHAARTVWVVSNSVQYRQTKNHRNLLRAPDCVIATRKCGAAVSGSEAGWWWSAVATLVERRALTEGRWRAPRGGVQRAWRRSQAFRWGWRPLRPRLARICRVLEKFWGYVRIEEDLGGTHCCTTTWPTAPPSAGHDDAPTAAPAAEWSAPRLASSAALSSSRSPASPLACPRRSCRFATDSTRSAAPGSGPRREAISRSQRPLSPNLWFSDRFRLVLVWFLAQFEDWIWEYLNLFQFRDILVKSWKYSRILITNNTNFHITKKLSFTETNFDLVKLKYKKYVWKFHTNLILSIFLTVLILLVSKLSTSLEAFSAHFSNRSSENCFRL